MRKFLSLMIIGIIFHFNLSAQLQKDVFPLNREFKRGGFFIEPQATISIGNKIEESLQQQLDTVYDYSSTGQGKWGYGIEVGWFHSFKNPRLIHFIELGVGYRMLQGKAEHNGVLSNDTAAIQNFHSDNTFKNQYLVASFRATNATQLGKLTFLSTSLGLNYNYQLSNNYERGSYYPPVEENFQKEQNLQLHLKIGVGMRLSRRLIAIPSIETPLLSIYPTNNVNPSFEFFSTRYQPIYIGIKFMFLREDPLNCNAPTFDGPQLGQ